MSQVIRPLRQLLLTLGAVAALGFGVASAFAQPVQPARAICTFLSDPDECTGCCQTGGYGSGEVSDFQCRCLR